MAMRSDRYNAREAEPKWQETWPERGTFQTRNEDPRPKYYVLEMFPYGLGPFTWGTSAITRWATSSPASCVRADQRPAPDGMGRLRHARRKCRRKTSPIPANGPTPIPRPCASSCKGHGPFRSIGRGKSRPATPAYYKHQRMFLDMLTRSRSISKKPRSIGIQWIRPFSPTNR